jgi:gas vesicle protein
MMNDPDEIRSNIEATRRELGTNVDALADKVTPAKIAQRQTDKIKDALGSARDHLVGSASDAGDSLGSASDAVADTAGRAKAKVEGNALAVGLIAFGVGMLAASLVPASTVEKDLAGKARDVAQPLVDDVKDAAKDAAQNLKEPAQGAVGAVHDSASDAVENVRAEATDAVADVREHASDAVAEVKGQSSMGT